MSTTKSYLFFLFLIFTTFVYTVSGYASSYSRLVSSGIEHRPRPRSSVGEQPLAKIAIHKSVIALHESASIHASPFILGIKVKKKMVSIIFLCVLDVYIES